MARPAISDERVIIEGPQSIRVKLKSRWTDGTESLLFTPSEFLERPVTLIPVQKFQRLSEINCFAHRNLPKYPLQSALTMCLGEIKPIPHRTLPKNPPLSAFTTPPLRQPSSDLVLDFAA